MLPETSSNECSMQYHVANQDVFNLVTEVLRRKMGSV